MCSPSRGPAAPGRRLDRIAAPWVGLTRVWRFDRMATVVHPATGKVTAVLRRGRETLRGAGRSAHRGAGTAKVWSRRPTTPRRNAGGAPCPTMSPSRRPKPRWTRSARGDTGCAATGSSTAPGTVAAQRRAAAAGPAGAVPGHHRDAGRTVTRRRWWPSAGTATRCHRAGRAHVTVMPRLGVRGSSTSPPAAGIVIALHHRPPTAPAPWSATTHVTALEHAALAAFDDRRAAPPQATHPTRPRRPRRRRRRRAHRQPPTVRRHRHRPGHLRPAAQGRNTLP